MREEEVKELIKKILQEAQATTSPAKEYGVFDTVESLPKNATRIKL